MRRTLVLSLVLLVATSGCSIVLVKPMHVTPSGEIACTRSYTVPLVDAAGAVAGLGTPLLLAAIRDRQRDQLNVPLSLGLAVTGVVYAISTVIGVTRVNRCRRLQASVAATAQPAATPAPAPR